MKHIIRNLFILLAILGIVSFLTLYYAQKNLEKMQSLISSSIQTSTFSQIQVPAAPLPQTNEIKNIDFISLDGKIKMTYSSDWNSLPTNLFLGKDIPNDLKEKYKLETLLFAQKAKNEEFAQLVVMGGIYDSKENVEKNINMMEKNNQKNGWKMEIINFNKNDDITYEAKYEKEGGVSFHSKEKVVFLPPDEEGEKKAYFFALVVYEQNWQDFKQEIENIINSIQVID